MTEVVIGVDPGLDGAIAKVQGGDLEVWDMPTLSVKNKRWVNAVLLADLLRGIRTPNSMVFVERVSARPGQGVTSMFRFGESFGLVKGVCAGIGLPLTLVTPQEWRRGMRVPPGKDGSRQRILELRPELAKWFARKKDQGRADAMLIALHGKIQ